MNNDVSDVFQQYPETIRQRLMQVRALLYDVAKEQTLGEVEETLKWGEPSYLSRNGSTVRLGWKQSAPDLYCVYFHCQTRLVETFRALYGDDLAFQGNRAIAFHIDKPLAESELKHCLYLALNYHKLKNQPLLGA
ncbi:DUF1801 domain-containing protein [Vibrio sp. S9_S30]|uniref:DUF1801 domain-containing protein n=1 Tax=Vibrio sp. S9_S30 TaxID=2720226 RepID=UPI001680FF09|nr:DUF1801 domain-containing protein [Vibrio sp. S9_S30]MBD1558062.1 DUF1801 domain-containing protein [Vibrio sp. S9_S30]